MSTSGDHLISELAIREIEKLFAITIHKNE